MTIQEYAKQYQTETDKQLVQKSTTSWMDMNATMVKYSGGNEVKIPYIEVNGYKDYDRVAGYPKGSATFKYETHTFDMDRGISFRLDAQDVDETNFGATTANLLKEFNATQSIPEKDAYRLSKVFSQIPGENKDTTELTEANSLTVINGIVNKVCGMGVDKSNVVIQITWEAYNLLSMNDKLFRMLNTREASVDGIKLTFKTIDDAIIIPTASSRMKTEYDFWTGDASKDGAENKSGFDPKANAGQINFMVMPANAPIGVTKCDKFNIATPEHANVTNYDGYIVNSRVYHTLILTARKAKACFANYTAGA